MYNLIIGYTGPSENENEVIVSASRFLEYTDSETQMRYRNLNADNVGEIKSFPALFMQEHCPDGAFVANITNVTRSYRDYKITFEKDDSFGVIPKERIENLAIELGIDEFEFYRTHWAVKNASLANILRPVETPVAPAAPQEYEVENRPPEEGSNFNKNQVFIVHGHDEHAKNDVKSYVDSKGLEPIILHLMIRHAFLDFRGSSPHPTQSLICS